MTTQDEKILRKWQNKNRIRNNTMKVYKSVIKHYTTCTQMTLSELYEEAILEEEQRIPRYRKKINDHILDYYEYMEHSKFTENTKASHIAIIKSFYISMDIELPYIKNKYDTTPLRENTEPMITKKLIKTMIKNAQTRDKAILSIALMTGQSPNEIKNITIQQIVDAWNSELETKIFSVEDIFKQKEEILLLDAVKLDMKRSKTNTSYWTYLPSETSKHIIDYLYERYSSDGKIKIKGISDLLFVSKNGEIFTEMSHIFIRTGQKCGFENIELYDDETRLLLHHHTGKHRVWKAYNFRKFFINMCRRYAGTRPDTPTEEVFSGTELADFWVGHVARGSIKHYLQYNVDDMEVMKIHYLQVLPYLSVETEVNVMTSQDKKEFIEIKEKYDELLSEMEDLKNYVRQKEEVNKLAKLYGLE